MSDEPLESLVAAVAQRQSASSFSLNDAPSHPLPPSVPGPAMPEESPPTARFLSFIPFIAFALAMVAALHWYVWAQLSEGLALPRSDSMALALIVSLLAISMVVAFLRRHTPQGRIGLLPTVAFSWMGLWFLLICTLFLSHLLRLALLSIPLAAATRLSLDRIITASAAGLALLLSLAAFINAIRGPRTVKVAVPVENLPSALVGYRIVQVSDIHVGPLIGRRFMEWLVEQINALHPDMVAITGDLVDGAVANLGEAVAPIRELRAPNGVFFIVGNHEYYADADAWMRFLPSLGVKVLFNQGTMVGEGDRSLFVAGVDDAMSRRFGAPGPSLHDALAQRPPGAPTLLLAHQPRGFEEAARAGVTLMLSGHTHGGQIFPFTLLVRAFFRYLAGLYSQGPAHLYVSRGTGFWGPPMRLGAPAEITLLTLQQGSPSRPES